MNNRMIDLAQKEIIQDRILEALEQSLSEGMSRQVIRALLKHMGAEEERTDEALWYLESKGWIRKKDYSNERQGIIRMVFFITDKGIDHLDGKDEEQSDG